MEKGEQQMNAGGIRGAGRIPGRLNPGPRNNIADVPGVRVGHWTQIDETHCTGLTVILPREDIYLHKCTAAVHVINGYGKSAGLVQIEELGQLETPIALTNTLNVGKISDALIQYTIDLLQTRGRALRSLNPVVGECNDASLNAITDRTAGYEQLLEAVRNASEDFGQGSVGAGAGMTCHDLKGGIGSASRQITIGDRIFTVGVLSLCNHGVLEELTVCGERIGPRIREQLDAEAKGIQDAAPVLIPAQKAERANISRDEVLSHAGDVGSCIIVAATDLPLSDRQLKRMIRRSGAGLARCGSYWGHGSGDIAIGFTTAHDIAEDETRPVITQEILQEKQLEQAFLAVCEAAEESVLNALAFAKPVIRPDGTVRRALLEFLPMKPEADD